MSETTICPASTGSGWSRARCGKPSKIADDNPDGLCATHLAGVRRSRANSVARKARWELDDQRRHAANALLGEVPVSHAHLAKYNDLPTPMDVPVTLPLGELRRLAGLTTEEVPNA